MGRLNEKRRLGDDMSLAESAIDFLKRQYSHSIEAYRQTIASLTEEDDLDFPDRDNPDDPVARCWDLNAALMEGAKQEFPEIAADTAELRRLNEFIWHLVSDESSHSKPSDLTNTE
ncbi:hypothetical protein [Neogemmobacter tilapiae]|uniref:Uncharacterized protein n=1 Tax=Neogemmobacter tilapiae TaxID=875041 RepID=A0A918TIH8_9RHOB|nr:hypothetical protein [Gemmobacter tilapiae]GHC48616.1 hypothetical protein GCM10007315_08300 [Gemmobacter tilapiae]